MNKIEKIVFALMSVLLAFFLCFMVYYHVNDITFHNSDGSCGVKYLFHLYCPGCGGTRAFEYFLHGQFIRSFLYHPFIMYIAVYFLTYYIPSFLKAIGLYKKTMNYMIYVYILCGLLAVIIIHFIVRNLLLVYCGIDYIGECLPYWQ